MVIRKSNIAQAANFRPTMVFHAIAWVELPPTRRLAFVTLPQDEQDFSHLLLHDVIVDGKKYFCIDVRTFTQGLHRKGESIGLLVEDTQSAN